MIKKFGFTLAEVLITLGIIGVVAAMTIPTLMQKTNDAELKSGFKKMISVVNQGISMNYALDGVDFSNISGLGAANDGQGSTWLGFLYNRLNVVGSGTPTGDITTGTEVFFSDGSSIILPATTLNECDTVTKCPVVIDVNGKKGPNTVTTTTNALKDRYTVYAYKRQFSPSSADADPGNYILKN
ncbi:type II secretion system protein [bacterium]|nr:type II secretion system protein [bacterium]